MAVITAITTIRRIDISFSSSRARKNRQEIKSTATVKKDHAFSRNTKNPSPTDRTIPATNKTYHLVFFMCGTAPLLPAILSANSSRILYCYNIFIAFPHHSVCRCCIKCIFRKKHFRRIIRYHFSLKKQSTAVRSFRRKFNVMGYNYNRHSFFQHH